MPKLVNYAARFEFFRQAAFEIVRDDGVDALTRRALAAQLGTGLNTVLRLMDGRCSLAGLAAREVATRRRRGRLGQRGNRTPDEAVASVVRSFMPEDASHLDEELVWLRLVAACSLVPSGLAEPGAARREFGIAERGYDDGATYEPAASGPTPDGHEDRRVELTPYAREREESLERAMDSVLEVLEIPEPRTEVRTVLIAVIEGLTLAACLGRITPEHATELAIAHVRGLAAARSG